MNKQITVRQESVIQIFKNDKPKTVSSVLHADITVPDWIMAKKNPDTQRETLVGWIMDKDEKGLIDWEGKTLREKLGDYDGPVKDISCSLDIVGGETLMETWS